MILGFWRKTHINYVLKIVKKTLAILLVKVYIIVLTEKKSRKVFKKNFQKKLKTRLDKLLLRVYIIA
jgi:diphthamide synthase (EF-2-diphthine--ammonia ligase)